MTDLEQWSCKTFMKALGTVLLALATAAVPAVAGTFNVTNQNYVTVSTGQTVIVSFSIWNYGVIANEFDPGSSPYPTELSFEAMGLTPAGATAPVPNASSVYYPGLLFQVELQSLNGLMSLPLTSVDSGPNQLNLPPGTFVVEPGAFTGAGWRGSTGELTGWLDFSSLAQSQALFGNNCCTPGAASANLIITNLGPSFTLGIPDYNLGFSQTLDSVSGPVVQVGVRPVEVAWDPAPEPPAWALILGALAVAALCIRRLPQS